MLTIAAQKSGRLSDQTQKLLHDAGIIFQNGNMSKLKSAAINFPLQILYLRDDDIPACVADGIAHVGIVGENVRQEMGQPVQCIEKLGFAKCRLVIAVPRDFPYQGVTDLNGLNIATSYPTMLKRYLNRKGIEASIHPFSGSVEITPGIGLADAIFDMVGTGSTLLSNGLKEVETVLQSEAVMIAHPHLDEPQSQLLDKLLFRIRAVNKGKQYKYILLNSPNQAIEEITRILPGIKSPTVMPLAMADWSSIHTVIEEDQFWEIIEDLKKAGAQGILVVPIEKMIA